MEYNVYEQEVLKELNNNILFYAKCIDFKQDKDGLKTLRFLNEDKSKKLAVITAINNQFQLFINDKPVKMLAPIVVKCQEVLLKYQDMFKRMPADAPSISSQMDIIKTEQKHDIYNAVKNPYQKLGVTNVPRPEMLFLTGDSEIYKNSYFHTVELIINDSTKEQRKITKKLFLNGGYYGYDEIGVRKISDNLYSVVVCDGDIENPKSFVIQSFDFHDMYNAYKFAYLLGVGDRQCVFLPRDQQRIVIKCKSTKPEPEPKWYQRLLRRDSRSK